MEAGKIRSDRLDSRDGGTCWTRAIILDEGTHSRWRLCNKMIINFVVVALACVQLVRGDSLSLSPKPTETREQIILDGVWNFRRIPDGKAQNLGHIAGWAERSLSSLDDDYERMPVPSSYNDITEKKDIRDYVGNAWYDREMFVPTSWNKGAVLLRFGSVNYHAEVYVNGRNVFNHTGGHLPFQGDVTSALKLGARNRFTVVVNNLLTETTVPQGHVDTHKDSRNGETYYSTKTTFDFFNYAGIHRSVHLLLVPEVRITDISVTTDIVDGSSGLINYNVKTNAEDASQYTINIYVLDKNLKPIFNITNSAKGKITLKNARLWWPYLMSETPGYLYTIHFTLHKKNEPEAIDSIYQKVGIRNIKIDGNKFLINGKAVYFRGFGKHEETNVRGRSMDLALVMKDFNLIKWIGANSFRTSHYPYSEEIMDEADAQGIMVIEECPAVALQHFTPPVLAQHLVTVTEMIDRDKNRPSVVMWSIANEPQSYKPEAGDYFKKVAAHVRELDQLRPVTAAINAKPTEHLAQWLDVLMINRYYGWYTDAGFTQAIQANMVADLTSWHAAHKKPVMVSEYGADTVAGLHVEPSFVFSEDYQTELLIEHFKAFDTVKAEGWFIGEHIWNFADFMTEPSIIRVMGNKKGIFTRERQPKTAARLLRCRYWHQSGVTNNVNHKGFSYCPSVQY